MDPLKPSPYQDTPDATQRTEAAALATFLHANPITWYILEPAQLTTLMNGTLHTVQSIATAIAAGMDDIRDHKTFYARNDNGPWEVCYR